MLVQVFRHSEAHKQGDKPKCEGKLQGPIRTVRGHDEALILLEDGSFVTVEYENLVVVPAKVAAKPVITKTPTPGR